MKPVYQHIARVQGFLWGNDLLTLKKKSSVQAYPRCGFASKMEGALFVLQTCSERIPWGVLSCANLFHNDWNVAELKTRRTDYTHSKLLLKSWQNICTSLLKYGLHFFCLVFEELYSSTSALCIRAKVQVNDICSNP